MTSHPSLPVMSSLPGPLQTQSFPSPASMWLLPPLSIILSLPLAPSMVSLPVPVVVQSLPSFALTVSSPPLPAMTSLLTVPSMISPAEVPVIVGLPHVAGPHCGVQEETIRLPLQTPSVQLSPPVSGFPSLQVLPFDLKPSAGQEALEPVQLSAASHCPDAVRQIVPAEANVQLVVQQEPAVPF